MMKKLLFIFILFIPTILRAETLWDYADSNAIYRAMEAWYERKLDIKAAQAICRRMLNVAESRDIEIVINDEDVDMKNYKPTMADCETNIVGKAMFIAFKAAEQLNIKIKKYDCDIFGKISIAERTMTGNLLGMYNAFKKVGAVDISCSNEENRCVANQVVTYGVSKSVYVLCLKIYDYKYTTTQDGSCLFEASKIDSVFQNRLYNSKSLTDFDKDCNPLFKE